MTNDPETLQGPIWSKFDAAGQRLTVDGTISDAVASTLKLLNAPELVVDGASLQALEGPGEQGVSLTGTTTLWGAPGVHLNMTFRGEAEQQKVGLQATVPSINLAALCRHILPVSPDKVSALSGLGFALLDVRTDDGGGLVITGGSSQSWDFQGIDGVGVSEPLFRLNVKPRANSLTPDFEAELTGSLRLQKTRIPIEIGLPLGASGWRIKITPPGVTLPSLSDIAELLAGAGVAEQLPPEINRMASFELSYLALQFDPQTSRPQNLDLLLRTANSWDIVPGLSLRQVSLSLLIRPLSPTGSALGFNGTVLGQVQIGSLDLAASLPIPLTGSATLEARGNHPLPGLAELADFTGASELVSFLPDDLTGTEVLALQHAAIAFDLGAKKLTSFEFELVTVKEWGIIPDHLSIGDLRLRLAVTKSGSQPVVTAFVGGSVTVGDARVSVGVERLGATGGWRFALTQPLSLPGLGGLESLVGGDFLGGFLPENMGGVGALTVYDFKLLLDAVSKKPSNISLGLAAANEWDFLPGYLTLKGLNISLQIRQPADAPRQITGVLDGTVVIGETAIWMQARQESAAAGWTFGGGLGPGSTVNLSSIVSDLLPEGVTLPDEVPDLAFSDLDISATPATGEFTLNGKCAATWELPFGVSGLAVSTVEISLHRAASTGSGAQLRRGKISCSLKLSGAGPVTIVEGLVFESLALSFDFDAALGWTLAGSVSAGIFDTSYTLAASLQQTQTFRRISLSASATSAALLSLDGVGSLSGRAVALDIVKALAPPATTPSTGTADATPTTTPPPLSPTAAPPGDAAAAPAASAVPLSTTSPYLWDLTISGGLKIDGVLDIEGTLQLYRQVDRVGLAFRAVNSEVKIQLPVHSINFHLGLDYISIIRTTAAAGAAPPSWAFDAVVSVWLSGLPASIQKILTQKVAGQFKTDSAGTQITINRLLQPLEVEVPDARAGSMTIEFGVMLLDASNLSLRSQGGNISLSMDFGVGLPAGLNDVFGKKDDGTPSVHFFNTYVKDNPLSVTRFRLSIETVGGLTIQTVTSPLAAVRLVPDGVNSWWYADLGDFGKIKLMVPVFSYTGDRFVARGGFQQVEPLKIPLTPLKLLLSAAGLSAAADALPKGIPLQALGIYDAETNEFKLDDFINALETLGGFTLPPDVKDALRLVGGRLDALPDRFKNYLDAEIPDHFEFDISVTPDGGARGKVWVTGDKPIKLLYPTLGLLGPVMTGVELYSVTFGEILGGSLMLLNVDARVDQYDLLELAAALALPLDRLPILPDTRSLSRRVVVKNLLMLVIYQTGIPVTVPLFFDQLGLEYLGLEGLELQTHWGFPKPKLSPADAGAVFKDFENFFTKPDHLLDADSPPQGLDLKLAVGPNYIRLPQYLGGKSLGSKDDTAVVSAYGGIAHLFNALKTLSLDELIQALPLEMRVGSEQVSFAGMTLAADWLVTTPEEFRAVGYRRLGVADAEVEQTLQVLPPSPDKNEQGLVVFLKGAWGIAGTASLGASFGLVGTSTGFGTGMRVAGRLNDLLDAELSGVVVIDPKAQDAFSLSGHSRLRVLGDEVFAGDLKVNEHGLAVSGRLDLFPRSGALRITGQLTGRVSDAELYISGGATVNAGGFFTLVSATAEITHAGVSVSGTWLNQTVTFSAQRAGEVVQLKATLAPVSVGDAFRLSGAAGAGGPVAVLGVGAGDLPSLYASGRIYLLGISAEATVSFSERGFSFDAEGQLFKLFNAEVKASGTDPLDAGRFRLKATMKDDLFAYLKEHATQAIGDAAAGATREIGAAQERVDAAQKEVDSLNRQIDDMRRTVKGERAHSEQKLQKARAAVNSAQDKVDTLQREIDAANRKIRRLKQDIADKKRWFDKSSPLKKIYRSATYSAYEAEKGAEISAQYAAIGGLETSKRAADAALKGAKQTLRGLEKASQTVPVDADPRVAALLGSKVTATGALTAADKALEGARASAGALTAVGDYIARLGLGGLLDVRAASFEATLDAASGGSVVMSAELVFMGKPQSADFAFNFQNLPDSAQNLARKLLDSQK